MSPQARICMAVFLGIFGPVCAEGPYPWLDAAAETQPLARVVPPPEGYRRPAQPTDSFGHWLRHLPIKVRHAPVHLYDGRLKTNQSAHHCVVQIDTGRRDLQQCADAVIRLRAEYLFSRQALDAIAFHFTNGARVPYRRWQDGDRPIVRGNVVRWQHRASPDSSYASFRDYLTTIFIYAGTISLVRDLEPVPPSSEVQIGDVFLQSGSPGHAVLVVDLARDEASGAAAFLLAQSYMPAQEIHILVNPQDRALSPWYPVTPDLDRQRLVTPEWTFPPGTRYRFAETALQANPD